MKNYLILLSFALMSTLAYTQVNWIKLPTQTAWEDSKDIDVVATDSSTFYAAYYTFNTVTSTYVVNVAYYDISNFSGNVIYSQTLNVVNPPNRGLSIAVSNDSVHLLYLASDQVITHQLVQIVGTSANLLGTFPDLVSPSGDFQLTAGSNAQELYLAGTKSDEFNAYSYDFQAGSWNNFLSTSTIQPSSPRIFSKQDSVFYSFIHQSTQSPTVYCAVAPKSNLTSATVLNSGSLEYFNSVTTQNETLAPNQNTAFLGPQNGPTSFFSDDATANGVVSFNLGLSGGGPAILPSFNYSDIDYTNLNTGGFVALKLDDGSNNIQLYKRDHISGGISTFGPAVTSVASHNNLRVTGNNVSDHKVVLFENEDVQPSAYDIYVSNRKPVVASSEVKPAICGLGEHAIFDEFIIIDEDLDSITIQNANSSNQSIIHPDSLRLEYTRVGSTYNAQLFGVFDDASISAPTQVTITLILDDDFETQIHTFTIEVYPSTAITDVAQTGEIELCINGVQEDLQDYFSHPGGSFTDLATGQIIPSIILPADLATSETTIDFEYAIDTGCYAPIEGTIFLWEPPTASLNNFSAVSGCNGNDGSIVVDIAAGSASNPNYYWNNGSTDLSISNLGPGQYTFNISDENACSDQLVVNLPIENFDIDATITDATCFGGSDGEIIINNVSGLNADVNYLWSTGHNTPGISSLIAGTYTILLYDSTGCEVRENFVLGSPDKIDFSANINHADCGVQNGSIDVVNATGGNGSYTYLWNTAQTTSSISSLDVGNYSVTVTDVEGCSTAKTYSLNNVGGPIVFGNVIPAACNNTNGGVNLTAIPTQGATNLTFLWSNTAVTEDISGVGPGEYSVVVSDDNGCNSTSVFNVDVRPPAKNPICMVDVDRPSNTNLVVWERLETTGIDHYNIYREAGPNQFMKIDQVPSTDLTVFNDVIANPVLTYWRYRISAVNDCGVEGPLSGAHKTIHMTSDVENGLYFLNWDYYQGASYSNLILAVHTNDSGWVDFRNVGLSTSQTIFDAELVTELGDTSGLDFDIGFEIAGGCLATKAEDFRYSRSNRTRGVFNAGYGAGNYSNNGISELTNESINLSVFPNPVRSTVTIKYEATHEAGFEILDLMGKTLYSGDLSPGNTQVDVSNLPQGAYLVKLTNGSSAMTRFIKN